MVPVKAPTVGHDRLAAGRRARTLAMVEEVAPTEMPDYLNGSPTLFR